MVAYGCMMCGCGENRNAMAHPNAVSGRRPMRCSSPMWCLFCISACVSPRLALKNTVAEAAWKVCRLPLLNATYISLSWYLGLQPPTTSDTLLPGVAAARR